TRKRAAAGAGGEKRQGDGGYLHVRSSLGVKYWLVLANSTGVIDADYRGEIIAVVRNIGEMTVIIEPGDRFCQIVIHKLPKVIFSFFSFLLFAVCR
ncbi:dCTP deaminase domain-containing protein, partial [Corynebacterium diphtheriae]|uniref:dCTP deaminase domain-containing protein n=1 Tax=Corynebacterium diphtheriae TaxID=1717 RepID=UPI003F6DC391